MPKGLFVWLVSGPPTWGGGVGLLTSDLELLQVAVVLGAVEEEAGLALGALDESVGGEQLLHHASLPQTGRRAVGEGRVAVVVEHARVKAHLGRTTHNISTNNTTARNTPGYTPRRSE